MKDHFLSNRKTILFAVLLCLVSMTIIIPVLCYSMLSIPYADDFSDARGSLEYLGQYGNWLVAALYRTRNFWVTFQGSYTGLFLVSFYNSYATGGILGLRLFNTVSMASFYLSLLYLVYVFCKTGKRKWILTLSVYTVIIYWITDNYIYSEIYTWNNVICIYVVPLIFVFAGEGLYIEYVRRQGFYWIPASVCGFFIGGGTINIATLGCGLFLITVVYGIFQRNLIKSIKVYIPFVFTVVCTLFNTLAPGNFIRWDSDGDVSLIRVAIVSVYSILKCITRISTTTPFIATLIILVIVAHKYGVHELDGKITYAHPLLVGVMYVTACGVVNFPYCLGNNLDRIGSTFEDRALFVQDVSIYLLTVLWIFYFSGFIRKRFVEFEFGKIHAASAFVVCATSLLLIWGYDGFGNMGTPFMIRTIADGSAKDYAEYQEEIIDQIRYGDNVQTIYYDSAHHEKKHPIIRGLRLSDDPERWDMWFNNAIAGYFGKVVPIIVYND